MGDKQFMKNQIKEKLKTGFSCIKMKIGAIDFDAEIELLKSIRKEFSSKEIELRVDANGAFNPKNALEKLESLSAFRNSFYRATYQTRSSCKKWQNYVQKHLCQLR